MPKKALKIGKDVTGKKSSGFFTSEKEREEYEEWRRQRDLAKEEEDAEKEAELQGKKFSSKMIEDKDPTLKQEAKAEERTRKTLASPKKVKIEVT